jgi:hypothetical protein
MRLLVMDAAARFRAKHLAWLGKATLDKIMNRTEKSGWLALGLSLFAVVALLSIGPVSADRATRSLSRPEVHATVFLAASRLYDTLPDNETILPDDPRARQVVEAIAPSSLTFITKDPDSLHIECGGGFQHYGFILRIKPSGVRALFLQIEGQPDKELKKVEPDTR